MTTYREHRKLVLSAALAFGVTLGVPPLAQASGSDTDTTEGAEPQEVTINRLAGGDRYATAAQGAMSLGQADRVYLASGVDFPDALAGSPAAIVDSAPLVLTKADQLPQATREALDVLAPQEVVVVGGETAISDDVLAQVEEITSTKVTRVYGQNRFGTAMSLALERFEAKYVDNVYVVSGEDYPDALSSGPAAGLAGSPILLTQQGHVPAETLNALQELDPALITVVGGELAVSEDVVNTLGDYTDDVQRIAGEDRYQTSALVADRVSPADDSYVASGEDYPDALAGAALAGNDLSALLLTRPEDLPQDTAQSLTERAPSTVTLFGGELAITDSVRVAIMNLFVD